MYRSIEEPVDSNFHLMALSSLVHMDLFHLLTPSQLFDLMEKVRLPGLSPVLDPELLGGFLEKYTPPPRKVVVRNYLFIILSSLFFIYLCIVLLPFFTPSIQNPQEQTIKHRRSRQTRFSFDSPSIHRTNPKPTSKRASAMWSASKTTSKSSKSSSIISAYPSPPLFPFRIPLFSILSEPQRRAAFFSRDLRAPARPSWREPSLAKRAFRSSSFLRPNSRTFSWAWERNAFANSSRWLAIQ